MAAKKKSAKKTPKKAGKKPCKHPNATVSKTADTWQRLWCPDCHQSCTRQIKLVTTLVPLTEWTAWS